MTPNNALNYRSLRSLDVQKLYFWPPVSLIVSGAHMNHRNFLTFTLLVVFNVTPALADWSMDFARITCIPEARYFRVDYIAISGPAVFLESQFNDEKQAKRLLAWKNAGYHEVRDFNYECSLPESVYKLTTHQPSASERGMCGGAPRITLNLLRNDRPILDKVTFGYDCFGGPTVTSAEITDGLQGWDTRQMTLCLLPKDSETQKCEFLSETYGAISEATPITQEKIEEYGAKHR